jgi:5-methylcytosine-specific restriction endonuclease McrA
MRICSGAGCLRAVQDSVRFCDECKPVTVTTDDGLRSHQRTDAYDDQLNAIKKTARWQKLRGLVVRAQPICRRCDLSITEIVDHIVPAQVAVQQARAARYSLDPMAGYFIRSNLQGLCRRCHGLKTVEDKAHQGEWPDVIEKERLAPKKVWTF